MPIHPPHNCQSDCRKESLDHVTLLLSKLQWLPISVGSDINSSVGLSKPFTTWSQTSSLAFFYTTTLHISSDPVKTALLFLTQTPHLPFLCLFIGCSQCHGMHSSLTSTSQNSWRFSSSTILSMRPFLTLHFANVIQKSPWTYFVYNCIFIQFLPQ